MRKLDDLGDRMKEYEKGAAIRFPAKTGYVVIRIDGKSFHTFTRNCVKPFDAKLTEAMRESTANCALDMQGCVLAYTQSDEATFILSDHASENAQGWFGYKAAKIISVAASMFTYEFNQQGLGLGRALFDARAFHVPVNDVANVLVWRQKDWERNSIQAYAGSFLSPKELHGKGRVKLKEILLELGNDWDALPPAYKYGSFFLPFADEENEFLSKPLTYHQINELINLEKESNED